MVWPFSRKANAYPPLPPGTDPTLMKKGHMSYYSTGTGVTPPKGRSFRTISLSLGMILCLLAILLPTTCDDTYLPTVLQLAVHQKMIAAYVLGLLTMGIVAYQ